MRVQASGISLKVLQSLLMFPPSPHPSLRSASSPRPLCSHTEMLGVIQSSPLSHSWLITLPPGMISLQASVPSYGQQTVKMPSDSLPLFIGLQMRADRMPIGCYGASPEPSQTYTASSWQYSLQLVQQTPSVSVNSETSPPFFFLTGVIFLEAGSVLRKSLSSSEHLCC